jgi:hypothetical protein
MDWIARMTSTSPDHWKSRTRPRSVAVEVNMRLTSSGWPMNSGRIERNAAMAPLTYAGVPVELNDPTNQPSRQPSENMLRITVARDLSCALSRVGFCLLNVAADRGSGSVKPCGYR